MMLAAISPATERAERLVEQIKAQADRALDEFGASLSGFAITVWDARGGARTAVNCQEGPIASALIPSFVHDAMNRHINVVFLQNSVSEALEDD